MIRTNETFATHVSRRAYGLVTLLGWLRRRHQARRRRLKTISLIHGSPHLLRDIGMVDNHITRRRP